MHAISHMTPALWSREQQGNRLYPTGGISDILRCTAANR